MNAQTPQPSNPQEIELQGSESDRKPMQTSGQLDPLFRKTYIVGGNATFTLVSKKTGERFTYKVRAKDVDAGRGPGEAYRAEGPGPGTRTLYFVSVLSGPDNTSDYRFLGTIFEGEIFRHGKKSSITPDAPSAQAFAWSWRHLNSDQIEIWHEGYCSRCGRALTTPESITMGLGPVCAGKERRAA